MKVVREISDIRIDTGSALTVGSFDGVHLGHKSIFENLIAISEKQNLESVIITFDPHPRKVLGTADKNFKLLTSLDEKIELFEQIGIDQILIITFTKEFAKLSYRQFVENILVEKLNVREMVIGYDHHFGKDREGGMDKLIELGKIHGFSVKQISPFTTNGKTISSSLIRQLLEEGEIEKANEFLGRQYSIKGKVVKGVGRGREIGFPTANIQLENEDKVVPKRGVYAVDVVYENKLFKGMMNIGNRPTFNFDSLTLEVHIFKFTVYIYDAFIKICFKKYIREEKKFSNVNELKTQLIDDKNKSENV
jgi:riboflavin kinase/FMN adenylyltransferase